MKKQRIKEVIVVEGRYDRNMLLQVVFPCSTIGKNSTFCGDWRKSAV